MSQQATTAASLRSDRKVTLDHPDLGIGLVPVESCVSQELFELEMEAIFRRVWINVGRVEEVPDPGDFVVKDLAFARASLLLVRGQDGVVRGFHNVCSHRLNKLVWDERGACKGFSCNYHGWTFALDGKLAHVPQEQNFFDLDRAEHALVPIRTEVWEGFVFINLNPSTKQTLKEYLGELGASLVGYPFDQLTCRFVHKAEVRCNWKLLIDAFQEGYHFPFQHKNSLAKNFEIKDEMMNVGGYRFFGPHRRSSATGNAQYIPTPAEAAAYGHSGMLFSSPAVAPDALPRGVNPMKVPNWATDSNGIFPNFIIQIGLQGYYYTWNSWPLAVDRSIWEVRAYYLPPKSAGERFAQEYFMCSARDTVLEDLATVEMQQQGLASRARGSFVLQDDEIMVRHFHKAVADAVRAYEKEVRRPKGA